MPKAKLTPNVISYGAAINSCEEGSQWQLSFELFYDMLGAKLTPNLILYRSAISYCELGGR